MSSMVERVTPTAIKKIKPFFQDWETQIPLMSTEHELLSYKQTIAPQKRPGAMNKGIREKENSSPTLRSL